VLSTSSDGKFRILDDRSHDGYQAGAGERKSVILREVDIGYVTLSQYHS